MKMSFDRDTLDGSCWPRFILLVAAMSWSAGAYADETGRTAKSKQADSSSNYPLELRVDKEAENFWQNIADDAEGNPFYFSGPHYSGNKFEWRKKVSGVLTNPRFAIRKNTTKVKSFNIDLPGATWTPVCFTGDLQPGATPDPNQPRYLDPGQNGKETYEAVVGGWISGKWVRSNGVKFDVKSRIVFWYDAADMSDVIGFAAALGDTTTDVGGKEDVLVCTADWDTAWGYQTVRGEFRSCDHGSALFAGEGRGTYAQIQIGGDNTYHTGFNQAGLGIAGGAAEAPGTHVAAALFLQGVTVYLNHCNSANRSCGYMHMPQNQWPLVENMDIPQDDANGHPRLIDTMDAVGSGVGSGLVKGWEGLYGWQFGFPVSAQVQSTTPGNPSQAQSQQIVEFVKGLRPTTYLGFKAAHGGTDQGWCQYFSAQAEPWAQNQFQDTTMTVTVVGGHQMVENEQNEGTQYGQPYD